MNNMRQLGMPLLYWNRIPDQGMLVDLTTKWLWGEAAISFLAEGVLNTITDDSGNPVTVVGSVLGNAVDTIVSAPGQWDPATWFFRMPIPEHEEFLWAYQSWYQQTNPEISLGWLFSEFLPNHFPFCRRVLMRFHQEEVESSSPDAHIKGRYDDIERRFEIDVRPLNAGSSMASTPDSSYLKAHEFIRLGEMGS
ncbi:MAG: hypothetical protein OEV64_08585, partial [Desulfobulbaceae bacterium]|nr:hypothetical protein [Desulfobulbaceae bacterium]